MFFSEMSQMILQGKSEILEEIQDREIGTEIVRKQ